MLVKRGGFLCPARQVVIRFLVGFYRSALEKVDFFVEHGLRFGAHGLPLMGSGDWNDGMNLVGIKGAGESVWLGFFLYGVLCDFVPVVTAREGHHAGARMAESAQQLLSLIHI